MLSYHPRHVCDVIKDFLNDAVDFITECYPVNSVYVASVNVTILSQFWLLKSEHRCNKNAENVKIYFYFQ